MPMLSISASDPFHACPTPFNMAEHVLKAGTATPDKEALLVVSEDNVDRWDYAALRRAVLGTATGFVQKGLVAGDKVLLRLGNTVDFPIAYLAALAVDLVPVPTSQALTKRETEYIISTLKPAAVVRDPLVACASHKRLIPLSELRAMRELPQAAFIQADPNRLGYVIFTSGTSGKPRAVAHAHRAIWARQMMFDGWYGLKPTDRMMHAGAFNWTYTLGTGLMDPWTVGATALIPKGGTDVAILPKLMREHGVSLFAAAPGVYRQMMDQAEDIKIPELRHGLSAGEKLPNRVAARWLAQTGTEIYEAYGMSECSTFISQAAGAPKCSGASGRVQSGRRVALLKDEKPVPRGVEGTIAVHRKDPGLMLGYLDAPDETAARMTGDWFLTGDQAVMSEQGDITYLGRNDDMMNAGGYRVSPLEVEHVLAQMNGVEAVGVAEVTIKADTRVIAAFYTADAALDDHRWRTYVSDKLARYKQPRLYVRLPCLPVGPNGKLLRRKIAADFERQNG